MKYVSPAIEMIAFEETCVIMLSDEATGAGEKPAEIAQSTAPNAMAWDAFAGYGDWTPTEPEE